MLARDAAENHRAEPAVADGQRLGPFHGGVGVEQRQRRSCFRGAAGLKNKNARKRGEQKSGQRWHGEIFASPAPHSRKTFSNSPVPESDLPFLAAKNDKQC